LCGDAPPEMTGLRRAAAAARPAFRPPPHRICDFGRGTEAVRRPRGLPGRRAFPRYLRDCPAQDESSVQMKDSFTYDQLIASGEGGLFGPAAGRLPLPPMLMFDRITHIDDDGGAHGLGRVEAELDIRPDLWFFQCHFSGDPVMPGCLGLDAMWQLVGFYLTWQKLPGRGRALGAGEVKFTGEVGPEAKLVRYE